MAEPLNILLVEDSPEDAELLVAELRRGGIEAKWKRVETEEDYRASLKDGPDLIICDYSLPRFGGLRAVDLLRDQKLDIPFFLVSGSMGEEQVVEAMQHGVTDYLLKDRIGRLGHAVKRALEQKRLRNERRRMRARLTLQATALETAANAILITDRAGTILWVNPAFTTVTGYTAEEAMGKTPRLLKSGKHDLVFYRNLWRTILSGKTWRGEFINRRKDGSLFYDEHTITPVRAEHGDITHFISVMHDMTKRREADERVRESEDRYRSLVEESPDSIGIYQDGRLIFVNSTGVEKLGAKAKEELLGRKTQQMIHPDDLPDAMNRIRRRLAGEKGMYPAEVRYVRMDGTMLPVEVSAVPITYGGKPAVQFIARDITERKQLEEQLRQAQKMEAIGHLAAGVAHDFNNMLAVIHGNAEMALMFADQLGNAARDCVKQVIAASERAANLTRQLLAFGRKQAMNSQPLNLNDVIGNLTKMLIRIIGENISLQCSYATRLPLVQADVGMMEQVILNLVVNARDAMPQGGQLLIKTEQLNVDEAYAKSHPEARTGEFICVNLSDTGMGITPVDLPRIFEPFYTTKEVGKGTGLGLATVYGIVKQHQGWTEVATQPGIGTTFKVFLPAISAPVTEAAAPPAAPALRGGTETILLVEDDPSVRLVTRRILEAFDYRVIEATSGREAMENWRSRAQEIDLLLTDIVMPDGVTGRDLAEGLFVEKPGLKAIFMSGYSMDLAGEGTEFVRRTKSHFLQKPFSSSVLIQTIRKCLDEK